MSEKGLGVDIIEVSRFRKMPHVQHPDFYRNIFTKKELEYCLSKSDPYQHFAVRFAAKEAVAKATGKSVYDAKMIEITNNRDGRPIVSIRGKTDKKKVILSLAHTRDYAIAFALYLKK